MAGLALAVAGPPLALRAQETPYLVKDINTATADSSPGGLTAVNGTLYFIAAEPATGGELWKSDGTAAGTVLVKDILPGPDSPGLGELADVNGTLFFGASGELWKSDGTEAGTVRVRGGFDLSEIENVNGTVFFSAFDYEHCAELWKSDGTAEGTVLVKDIAPGCNCHFCGEVICCEGSSYPRSLTDVDGTLFFVATDSASGAELWMSDGTEEGTVLVKDINPGSGSSNPTELTNVNGRLFFVATEPSGGTELWTSDGTEAGTVRVKDINPGTASSSPRALFNMNGTLLFRAREPATGSELWRSDGTEMGTVLVKDINPGPGDSSPPITSPRSDSFGEVNGTAFFAATDGTTGSELWRTDGTEAGTMLVKDIRAGPLSSLGAIVFVNVNGTLFFGASDGTTGGELWKSDGTAAGTVLVRDINPGPGGSLGFEVGALNGIALFTAFEPTTGRELWRSDGTAAGTALVRDINTDTLDSTDTDLTAVGARLFFHSSDPATGPELWTSDGTAAGTHVVKDINPGPGGSVSQTYICNEECSGLVPVNQLLFFPAFQPGTGLELWKTDGTEAGTVLVKDINPGAGDGLSPPFLRTPVAVNGTLFFSAFEPANGVELWKSDGTAGGTVLVKDIKPGPAGSYPFQLAAVNGRLFFAADDGTTGGELWKSDGTAAGTVLVKDIWPGPNGSIPYYITDVNGTAFFSAGDDTTGSELWKSDGTAAGTVLVKDIWPGPGGSSPRALTNVNGRLFFVASHPTYGDEVWTSDGTEAGTVLTKDINPGLGSGFGIYEPEELTSFMGELFFRGFEPSTQNELWKSDGTEAGTVLVKDINPGSTGSAPSELTVVNGTLYFRAFDPTAGYELWKSDGTEAGTVRVTDITPGSYGRDTEPRELTNAGGRLFFTAFEPRTGRELWALAACGNDFLDPGEECDDGNTLDGDCCSATCGSESGACDDGNVCTTGDVCAGGVCTPGPDTCATILGRSFLVRDPRPGRDPRPRKVAVVAREERSSDPLLGDPSANGATIEVFANGATPSTETFDLPPGGAWETNGPSDFRYRDRAGAFGAVSSAVIKRSANGTFVLRLMVSGRKGPVSVVPPAPGTDGGMRVRIRDGSGYCVRFGADAGGVVSNTANRKFRITDPTAEASCP